MEAFKAGYAQQHPERTGQIILFFRDFILALTQLYMYKNMQIWP